MKSHSNNLKCHIHVELIHRGLTEALWSSLTVMSAGCLTEILLEISQSWKNLLKKKKKKKINHIFVQTEPHFLPLQYFKTYPIHIPGLWKNGPIHILDHPKCWPIHILPFDLLYPFFAGYYTNIIVNSCNTNRISSLKKISERKICAYTRMSEKWGLSHRNPEKWGHSYTFCWKKGANHIPGSPEKGGYSAGTSVLCHI